MAFNTRNLNSNDYIQLHALVARINPLRQYDEYIYKTICDFLNSKSILLEWNNEIVGLAIGFVLPDESDAFNILQFGILQDFRKDNIAYHFFKDFLRQFSSCSRFYFTINSQSLWRLQILRLIESAVCSKCIAIETINFTNFVVDYKYVCDYNNREVLTAI